MKGGVEKEVEKYLKIIGELTAKPNISRIEPAEKLNEKPTTIQSKLRNLVRDGLIKRTGPDKCGYLGIIMK